MEKYMSLSNYGYHLFIENFESSDIVPSEGTKEVKGILSVNIGGVSKDIQTYRTLDGEGYESIVSLGQALAEGSINCLRTGVNSVYTGEEGDSAYQYFRKWMDEATANGGVNAERAIVEVVPRGESYEGTVYYCVPVNFQPGEKSTDGGQTFSLSVKPFGKSVPVKVSESDGTFTFEKYTTEEEA